MEFVGFNGLIPLISCNGTVIPVFRASDGGDADDSTCMTSAPRSGRASHTTTVTSSHGCRHQRQENTTLPLSAHWSCRDDKHVDINDKKTTPALRPTQTQHVLTHSQTPPD